MRSSVYGLILSLLVAAQVACGQDSGSVATRTQLTGFQFGGSDSAPAFQVTPYGSVWGSMRYATSRTSPDSFTLWVPSESTQGEPAFSLDARRSRLGVNIDGPDLALPGQQAKTRAQIEFDFFGQFVTENRAGARLRQAWWSAETESFRVLIGQTWDVISPLRPGTLNLSVGWNGGNIGFRRAQFRVERFFQMSRQEKLTLQAAVSQDIISDFPSDTDIDRESADWPVLQGRVEWAVNEPMGKSTSFKIGVSGHIGETGFDFLETGPPPLNLPPEDDARFETWSWNIDARADFGKFELQGEFFRGANLSPFLGGIGQGVCPCLRVPIRATGGWLEAVYHWTPKWESHAGTGIDDPNDSDSQFGRIRNQFIFGNIIWHVTPNMDTGFEVTWWRTDFHETRAGLIDPSLLTPDDPGEAYTFEWMVRYNF